MADRLPGENPPDARRRRPALRALTTQRRTPRPSQGWILTTHAEERAAELGFTVAEGLAAANDLGQTYCCGPQYTEGQRIHQREDVALVVDPDDDVVVTVLLRTTEEWTHGVDRRPA